MIKGINEREGIEKSLKKQFTWMLQDGPKVKPNFEEIQ